MKKKSLGMMSLVASLLLSGCSLAFFDELSIEESSSTSQTSDNRNQDIYNIYLKYQEAGGSLTYEQWLATIKKVTKGTKATKAMMD